MTTPKLAFWITALWLSLIASPLRAQVLDPWQEPDEAPAPDPDADADADADPDPDADPDADAPSPDPATRAPSPDPATRTPSPDPDPDAEPAEPIPPIVYPLLFASPTGRLLPAGMIYSSTGIDTGGGLSSELRVGLGRVAEFGIGTTDLFRSRVGDANPDRIQPYFIATFKMGIEEHLLFRHQPALALGFRKSFVREDEGRDTRAAALYLVGTKSLGERVSIHAGGVFWDASVALGDNEVFLHDKKVSNQLRAFGGLELEPLPDAQILLELFWAPEFRYAEMPGSGTDSISLTPMFSWGVRYKVGKSVSLESGVRIPDIKDANLIDAQIFGQLTWVSRKLSNWLESVH